MCDAFPVELETPGQSVVWLESYFEDETMGRLVSRALENEFPGIEFGLRPCPTREWTTFWRHHFRPRDIGDRLRVVPEWLRDEDETPPGRARVLVNPGMSFGTGDHFTTRYCLRILDQLAGEGMRPEYTLDAGCGSAILSIAAHKLGWQNVLAVDHDPVAIEQAALNLELNGVQTGVELRVMDLTREWPEGVFPVVFANLYGGLLMDLAPRLVASCAGFLVLSGIRVVEADAVSSVFAQIGARERGSDADHEWCGMWFECGPR